MYCPNRGDAGGHPKLTNQPQHQKVHQHDVSSMQEEIDPVISSWLILVPENRVVEQIRDGGKGTIESGLARRPPVRVLKNQADVLSRSLRDPWISKKPLVVERESGLERIGKCQQRDGEQS